MSKNCKRLGNAASDREVYEKHRVKMEMKRVLNEHNRQSLSREHIFANLSKNHPEYGNTPADEYERKAQKE